MSESKGMETTAERTPAGYRLYTTRDVELLTFIRRPRTLGLHLDAIREVLAIRDGGIPLCATVRDLLDAQIAELDATVAELLGLKQGAGARDGCRRWQRTGAIPRRTAPDADG